MEVGDLSLQRIPASEAGAVGEKFNWLFATDTEA